MDADITSCLSDLAPSPGSYLEGSLTSEYKGTDYRVSLPGALKGLFFSNVAVRSELTKRHKTLYLYVVQ